MKTTKTNIGLSLSRNFNKVTLEVLDEAIEHENQSEFDEKVVKIFSNLRRLIEGEFKEIEENDD